MGQKGKLKGVKSIFNWKKIKYKNYCEAKTVLEENL